MARGYDDYDDYDDYDRPPRPSAAFPGTVTAAGVIWIIYGSLQLIFVALNVINILDRGMRDPVAIWPIFLGLLFGVGFLVAGIQSVNGSARDVLGNAIGSLIIAGLAGAGGLVILVQTRRAFAFAPFGAIIGILLLLIFVVAGLLLLAGILALSGRGQYRRWKDSQRPPMRPRPRRRRRDDYYDDEYE